MPVQPRGIEDLISEVEASRDALAEHLRAANPASQLSSDPTWLGLSQQWSASWAGSTTGSRRLGP